MRWPHEITRLTSRGASTGFLGVAFRKGDGDLKIVVYNSLIYILFQTTNNWHNILIRYRLGGSRGLFLLGSTKFFSSASSLPVSCFVPFFNYFSHLSSSLSLSRIAPQSNTVDRRCRDLDSGVEAGHSGAGKSSLNAQLWRPSEREDGLRAIPTKPYLRIKYNLPGIFGMRFMMISMVAQLELSSKRRWRAA